MARLASNGLRLAEDVEPWFTANGLDPYSWSAASWSAESGVNILYLANKSSVPSGGCGPRPNVPLDGLAAPPPNDAPPDALAAAPPNDAPPNGLEPSPAPPPNDAPPNGLEPNGLFAAEIGVEALGLSQLGANGLVLGGTLLAASC